MVVILEFFRRGVDIMNRNEPNNSQTSESWDTYWQGTSDAGAFSSGGVSHPAIRSFWVEFFSGAKQRFTSPRILDIASGNGAVLECVLDVFNPTPSELSSLDVSEAAIKNIHTRFPSVIGIVASASSIPRESSSFDIVTSQYGIEYAGYDAILEAARLVADTGQLVLLMHCESGHIHLECEQSLDAIERTQKSNFVQLATAMLDAGFKSVRGADRKIYEQAAQKLAPAITELEAVMRQYGSAVAGGTICRMYNDVDQIHQKIQHYEPVEVLTWLHKMDAELDAYAKRMLSMSLSAVSSAQLENMKEDLNKQGFIIDVADKLFVPGNKAAMAWVLIATK